MLSGGVKTEFYCTIDEWLLVVRYWLPAVKLLLGYCSLAIVACCMAIDRPLTWFTGNQQLKPATGKDTRKCLQKQEIRHKALSFDDETRQLHATVRP